MTYLQSIDATAACNAFELGYAAAVNATHCIGAMQLANALFYDREAIEWNAAVAGAINCIRHGKPGWADDTPRIKLTGKIGGWQ